VNRNNLILALVLILAVLAVLWLRRPPNDGKLVARRVAALAECLSKSEGETNSVMALKFNALSGMFADSVAVEISEIPFSGTYSSGEIPSHITRYRAMLDSLALSFHDIRVATTGTDRATATFTVCVDFCVCNG